MKEKQSVVSQMAMSMFISVSKNIPVISRWEIAYLTWSKWEKKKHIKYIKYTVKYFSKYQWSQKNKLFFCF